jgi:glycerol-3-phosphate dehydrogenase
VSIETADRGRRAAGEAGALVGEVLGWDAVAVQREVERYRRRVDGELAALEQPDDRSADAARRSAGEPRAGSLAPGKA